MKSVKSSKLAGPYFITDIPEIRIDYKGLTAYAREKGIRVCDLTDAEKNAFIVDADMRAIRGFNIDYNC